MPERPLPDSREQERRRAQRLTQRIAGAVVLLLVLTALVLYLLA